MKIWYNIRYKIITIKQFWIEFLKSIPEVKFYAEKKNQFECIFCQKRLAIKKGKREGKQKFNCLSCKKWFSVDENLKKKKKCSVKILDEKGLLLDHLVGISYRNLEFRTGISKKKVCKIVNEQTARFAKNIEITKYFFKQLKYSGNHVVDGKYIPVKEEIDIGIDLLSPEEKQKFKGKIPKSKKRQKVKRGKVLIWGADYESHDIPHYEFDFSENGIAFDRYFRTLNSIGYDMKSLTFDDRKSEIMNAARRHYPNCVFQLCIKHYLDKILKKLKTRNIKIKIKAKQKQIEKLFDGEESESIPITRIWSIRQACRLANEIADLEFNYELALDFEATISSILKAGDFKNTEYRIKSLEKYFWPRRFKMKDQFPDEQFRAVKILLTDFKENKKYLLNYLKHPHLNIPRTTNLIEGINSQLELRLSSIKGFETDETADNYMNVWILKRRFTKFTDCKGKFKKLNGKAPLECAGVNISKNYDWTDFCQNEINFDKNLSKRKNKKASPK